ncbi:MAG TPA: amidohydrolase [Anaerolineae bacterium]|nr:amidohydrolase [Anaerolineae bacterium]
MPVIDFHVHIAQPEHYHPWVIEWMQTLVKEDFLEYLRRHLSPEGMREVLRESGVDYAVALAEVSPITTGVTTNEYVAEFCRGVDRLIPFANINPFTTARPAQELERCVRELGFRGLKLYPTYQYFYPNDPLLYPLYAKAQELGIPVMFHTGSSVFRGSRLKYGDPLYLDDVAVDFPDLVIVQAHSGRGFWYDRAAFLARLHPNVYMEVSGLPPHKLLDYFPDLERLADKVIFGSDWPGVPSIKANIEAIRALPISEEAKAKILGENAARILGLKTGA